ncbi:MAG: ABC transporter permease, partial [Coleofasciculaceae cyanobacterium SM2_3_26]|nr:ABC transporter permease [Coleofasciculaceae cyanobacterium SM2_3_26]
MNGTNFLTDYLVSSLHLSVPLAFAALGGLWSERSGVLNIGLEGMLLSGAFVSAAIAVATGSAWLGIWGAIALGALVGLLHGFSVRHPKGDQVVSGLAINLAAAGLTSFWARILFASGEASQLPAIEPLQIPWLSQIPLLGRAIFQQDTLFYLLLLLVGLSTYTLFYTSVGLSLRSVGEAPKAADTAGISVALVRYGAVILCGALAGLGRSLSASPWITCKFCRGHG